MKFFNIRIFYLTGIVLISILFYIRLHYKNKAKIARLGDEAMVRAMCGSVSTRKRFIKRLLKLTAMLLLITAMARPKAGLKAETVTKSGIDIIIALDVSKSMLTKDIAPNRFERAKLELLSLVDKLKNDRIALVLFSGSAFMQMPLTLDYSAAKLFIKNAYIDALPTPGSAGAAAVNISLDVFERVRGRAKAIVIFTDGEFHDKNMFEAAMRAKEGGVAIYAVGFGTESGGPIPVPKKGGVTNFKKDKMGKTVLSKMNVSNLIEATQITNGRYFLASEANMVGNIKNDFDALQKSGIKETIYTQFEEKFQIPLLLAALMLLADSLTSDRKKQKGERIAKA